MVAFALRGARLDGPKQSLKDSDAEHQTLVLVTGFSPQQPLPPAAL